MVRHAASPSGWARTPAQVDQALHDTWLPLFQRHKDVPPPCIDEFFKEYAAEIEALRETIPTFRPTELTVGRIEA
eukprot:12758925-Heterocapsa_arctica.AAC.1